MLLELSVEAVHGDVLCVGFLSVSGDSTVFEELSVSVLVSRNCLEFGFMSMSVGVYESMLATKAKRSYLSSVMKVWIEVWIVFSEVWIVFLTVSSSCAVVASDLFLSSAKLLLV